MLTSLNPKGLQFAALSAALAFVAAVDTADAQGSHRTFNVKSFGAIGNGTTDDTAAIQAALTAAANTGAQVVFPSGTYLISTGLTGSGVAVVGSNATLVIAAPVNGMLTLTGSSPSVASMNFDALNGSGSFVMAISIRNASNANATGNSVSANLSQGISYSTVTGGAITSNNLLSSGNGINVFSSSGVTVTKNTITSNSVTSTSHGILDSSSQNTLMQGNVVNFTSSAAQGIGIETARSTSAQVVKNTVTGAYYGIQGVVATTPLIDHNVVTNAQFAGIFTDEDTNDVISNNAVTNSANHGLLLTASSGTVATTNTIDGAGGNGIQAGVDSSAVAGGNIAITNNAIANCGLTTTTNAIIQVNNTAASAISVTGNQYKGNTANVTDFIHVTQSFATVTGNKTNSLLPTVVGP